MATLTMTWLGCAAVHLRKLELHQGVPQYAATWEPVMSCVRELIFEGEESEIFCITMEALKLESESHGPT